MNVLEIEVLYKIEFHICPYERPKIVSYLTKTDFI